jgi:glutaredoxin
MINGQIIEDLKERFDVSVRTVPQVVIDNSLIGGYNEVEALMKGPTAINKV